MKAIQTKYLPATNTKGSRIKASAEGVGFVTIDYPHEVTAGEDAHRVAARALVERKGLDLRYWSVDDMAGGCLPDGSWCFVTMPRLNRAAPELLEALRRHELPFDNEAQARAEFGDDAVSRELQRRAAIAKAEG